MTKFSKRLENDLYLDEEPGVPVRKLSDEGWRYLRSREKFQEWQEIRRGLLPKNTRQFSRDKWLELLG